MRGTVCSIVGFFASFGANSTISYCAETSIVKILDFFLENHQTFHFFIVGTSQKIYRRQCFFKTSHECCFMGEICSCGQLELCFP